MTKSRTELMQDRLRDMQVSSPDIEASAVVSVDGLPIATREAGEVRFLGDIPPAKHWEIRNALIRRSVPPQLRAYLGQPA